MNGVVTVTQGRLRGVWRGPVVLLWHPLRRGRRWACGAGAHPWRRSPGTRFRDASTFDPPQSAAVPGITSPSDPEASEPHSEDCLSLNVWTPELPEVPTTSPGAGRPVLVFIHGGGFTSGSGSVFLYRGSSLVRNGDAVVVTVNYRLGALGFLGHRGLADPDGVVGNWGIQDQVAALRWVHEHIAAFGGDPSNVTIFGESAGGFSVATLLGTPAATGLFRRAMVQSGGIHVHSVEEAEESAERLAAVLGVASCDRTSLEPIPASELVAATEEIGRRRPDPGMIPLPFLPVVDGAFLPGHPLAAVAESADGIDLLIGTNRDELTLFGLGNPVLMALDEDGMRRWVANAVPDIDVDEVIDVYRSARRVRSEPVEPTDIWVAVGTDVVFRWPSLQLAAAHAARGASSTHSNGSPRLSVGSCGPATPWSCPSSSGPCTSPLCRCSRGAGRPSRPCRRRCSGRGSPSPRPETRATRASGRGVHGIRSAGPPWSSGRTPGWWTGRAIGSWASWNGIAHWSRASRAEPESTWSTSS